LFFEANNNNNNNNNNNIKWTIIFKVLCLDEFLVGWMIIPQNLFVYLFFRFLVLMMVSVMLLM
jgi:hypothetical protein